MITTTKSEEVLDVYTKEHLEKGLFFLARQFFSKHPFESWDGVNSQNIIVLLNSKKTYSKTEMLQVSLAVFQNDTIIKAFLKIPVSFCF